MRGRARSGLKEYHNRMQKRESPFLPVLEEIEERMNALSHVPLGLDQIPLSKVVGTASKGRTNAFAANFMPILDPGSEFGTKWGTLYEGIVEQGLNQPVKVLEYLGQYYLVEGNKRVSVMKYLDSMYIEAEVTRVLPRAPKTRRTCCTTNTCPSTPTRRSTTCGSPSPAASPSSTS